MKEDFTTIVGMDVHKSSITIAFAGTEDKSDVRLYGKIGGTAAALDTFLKGLVSKGIKPRFVYEAGPCGYVIYRHLTKKGYPCKVIAPSLTPRKSGDRIKNDTRDAITLARSERSGDLTEVIVPSEEDEAMRDLTRAREDAVKARTRAYQHLKAFLLRRGIRYGRKGDWGPAHMAWLHGITMDLPASGAVLEDYIATVVACQVRVKKLEEEIKRLVPGWRMGPVVRACQAMRGIGPVTAATIAAETGDMARFASPEQFMAYIGIIPSESSTGDTIRRGRITKTGNSHIRFVLIEAAKQYCHAARISRELMKRQEGLAKDVIDIAWKAQKRLCKRFITFVMRGKHNNTTAVAIARELAGFVWALVRQVQMAA